MAANRARARGCTCAASDRVEAEPAVPSLLRPSAPIKHEDCTVQRSIRGILDAVLIDIDDDPASNRTEWHESKRNALGISTAQLYLHLGDRRRVEFYGSADNIDANLLHAGGDIDEREVSRGRGRRASEIHETNRYVLEEAFPWVTLAVCVPVANTVPVTFRLSRDVGTVPGGRRCSSARTASRRKLRVTRTLDREIHEVRCVRRSERMVCSRRRCHDRCRGVTKPLNPRLNDCRGARNGVASGGRRCG